ncbi:MAG: class I SAM-dependent methyltransferase [Chitinophagaceae bacterium]|nr:MAG: class I SAM-dependent methyltransferase [Chitinophagaceae bacterium]
MVERKYWEKIAPSYEEEIFDVLKQDKQQLIRQAIESRASASHKVVDAGCAVGKWLPVLSPLFQQVTAVDISAKNLAIAAAKYPELTNVTYQRADLSSAHITMKGYDMAICINAILSDSMTKRDRFFNQLSKAVKTNGSLVLVVPSLESWLLSRTIQKHYKIDQALFRGKITDSEAASRYNNIQQGNVEIDDVATKHYLGPELQLTLERNGFAMEEQHKVEYDWHTEFVAPPAWLKDPKPFDWLCVCRKKN